VFYRTAENRDSRKITLERFGFICNPRAGQGCDSGLLDHTIHQLRALGHEANLYETPFNVAELASRALNERCTVIVAFGGDGTVSTVAGVIFQSGVTLGVFPAGTCNHFANDLGIRNRAIAENVLLRGRTRQIDAATVNGRLFINNSGIGIYPAMVMEREAERRLGIARWPAFFLASCKTLANLRFMKLQLDVNGKRLERSTSFLFVGNNIYQLQGFSPGRRARLDAGELAIVTARRSGRTGLVCIAFRALLGSLRADRDFRELAAAQFTVRTRRATRLNVSLDGELSRMDTPLQYSILPGALRVLAP